MYYWCNNSNVLLLINILLLYKPRVSAKRDNQSLLLLIDFDVLVVHVVVYVMIILCATALFYLPVELVQSFFN